MNQMQDWLAARAAVSPNKLAIITDEAKLTYSELNIRAASLAVMIRENFLRGQTAKKRIALYSEAHLTSVILIHALAKLGHTTIPINTRLNAEEIKYQLINTDAALYIIPHNPNKENFRRLSEIPFNEFPHKVGIGDTFKNYEIADHKEYLSVEINLSDPFAIIHTSGTSGKPKGAVLTYGNMFYSAMASAYRIGHMPDDKWLCVLPLYHMGGLSILIRAVLYGITVDLRQRFDVDEINHALTHNDITLVSLVPTMLYRLLEARKEPWNPKLRLVLVGGAATTPELVERCKAENIPIATTYGMTEAASQIATTLPDDAIRKVGTVGKPLMFTQIRVVNENGENQPRGEYGEILVKGSTVMQGYYGDEEATNKAFSDGWFHTGDIGYFDNDGDLFLVQRRSDLIVSGGENVYPSEVEAVLRKHPAIKEVAVAGVDDAEWGQKVAAAIILENGQSLSEDDVGTYSREHLAGYKIPRIIKFVDALPMTGSGKIQRGAVRDLFNTEVKP